MLQKEEHKQCIRMLNRQLLIYMVFYQATREKSMMKKSEGMSGSNRRFNKHSKICETKEICVEGG